MATLLNGVNEVLQRVHWIDSEGELGSLTNSAKQTAIDLTVQIWNEQIDHLYSETGVPYPKELATSTITLTNGDRDYALPTDLVQLHYPLLDETNGRYITEYPGGYMQIVRDQPIPSNHTGVPISAAIRPTDGELYLDTVPTADEQGLVYTLWYDKDLELTDAGDAMPFSDAVFRALVPAVAEVFKLYRNGKEDFTQGSYRMSMARAARLVTQQQPRRHWTPVRIRADEARTDPFNDG